MSESQPPNPVPSAGDRLDSWKSIAAYLKRDVRTVQRWERQEALPVHRHVHATQGSVYAFAPELDAWWAGRRSRLESNSVAADARQRRQTRVIPASAAALAVLTVGLVLWALSIRSQPPVEDPVRFSVLAPAGTRLSGYPSPAVSPDGRRLVFVTTSASGRNSLWIRRLDSPDVSELADTEGAEFPFWSPDSHFVAFFARGKLMIADISQGHTRIVCDSPGFYGGAWSRDGVILFAPTDREIFRVSASGGEITRVTQLDASAHEAQHMWSEFLPDGRRFLYLSNVGPGAPRSVRLGSLDSAESRVVVQHVSHAAYATPDYLLFVRDSALLAQRFDPDGAGLLGEPVTIASDVGVRQPIGRAAFSVSQTGVLIYRTSEHILSQPILFDRSGRRLTAVDPPADHDQPRLSPDEQMIAVSIGNLRGPPGRILWLLQVGANKQSRLNLGSPGSGPVWSPDGKSLAFTSRREGPGDLYRRPITSDAQAELLLRSPEWKIVTDWSNDGTRLIYQQKELKTQWDVWTLQLDGTKRSTPLLRGEANEQHGRLSPDGKWLAYTSDESGRPEIYVRRLPQSEAHWKISSAGGVQPEWRRDGKELFYISSNRSLVAQMVEGGENLDIGVSQPLFTVDTEGVLTTPGTFHYSPSADGQRFLVNTVVGRGTPTITVVVNWTAALNAR